MLQSIKHEHMPYIHIGHCAGAVDFKDLINGDFKCELRVMKVVEGFRGAVRISLYHAWFKPMRRYTRIKHGKPRYYFHY